MGINYNPTVVLDSLLLNLDFGNKKNYSYNVHPYPNDIRKWVTAGFGYGVSCTISSDNTQVSPAGGLPLKMVQTGNDAYVFTYGNYFVWNLSPAKAGETWTVSVYVKASAPTTIEGPYIFGVSAGGIVLTAVSQGSTVGEFSVDTNWKRISFTSTLTDANTAYIQTRLDGKTTGGAGITIWWDGLQVEKGSSATDFNPNSNSNGIRAKETITNSNFVFNGDGYWNHANGVITFDRTSDNLLAYSEELDNTAGWSRTRTTLTQNAIQAPDGISTAEKIVATSATSSNHHIYQNVTVSSTSYSFSCYAKAGEYSRFRLQMGSGGPIAGFNLSTGTVFLDSLGGTGSITSVGNGWYRCEVKASLSSGTVTNYILLDNQTGSVTTGDNFDGDGVSGIYVWGAQLTLGSSLQSYNKTTTLPAPKYGAGCGITTTGDLTVSKFLYNNHTWELWFKINDRVPGVYGNNSIEGISTLALYRGYHAGFWYSSTALTYQFWDGIVSTPICASWTVGTSGAQINEGSWAQVVVTRSGNVFTPYVNGVQIGTGYTRSPSNTGIGTTNELWIGKTQSIASNTGQFVFYSKNTIGNMKMYNRALSALEVEQNFAALRGRYGI
jgi:hypothetical protein